MLQLVRPAVQYKASFIEAASEFAAEKHHRYKGLNIADLDARFEQHVDSELKREGTPPRPDWVPDTILWLVEGDRFIGRISIRHYLMGTLEQYGGHIGYEIRPSQRRKGYGTLQLELALPIARDDLNITKVLITCDPTNTGSRKIIEANGGVLQDTLQTKFSDLPTMRWWIDLGAPKL
jgi:predicted acetyltransferase